MAYEFGLELHEGKQMTELLPEWLIIWAATTIVSLHPTKGDKESGSHTFPIIIMAWSKTLSWLQGN